ncbi:MAG: S1-like domain-containing RNA-binding protein [Bacteroidia bacterium]|nr:S1-like domain-containing RNA-binding protein [Bacteroidia bacterium]
MEIGKTHRLKAARTTDNGCYLIDDNGTEVLLPNVYVSDNLKLGDEISVFVYLDNEERPVATTIKPHIELDKFAFLEVKDVNRAGAFMDIGLIKQLLVPFSEQPVKMEVGEWYVVFCLLDEQTDRLIASAMIDDFVFTEGIDLEEGDEVEALFYKKSDLGINAIVNNQFKGLVFQSDIDQDISIGNELKVYVKKIRSDGKIDLILKPQGYRNVIDQSTQSVLDQLKQENGFFKYTDKSSPDDIRSEFGMSKKAFKKALGNLYKQKIVRLEKDGTYLIS